MNDDIALTRADVLRRVTTTITAVIGIPREKMPASARLVDDLGADSLDAVEVIMALEEEFQISLDKVGRNDVSTIDDIVDLVCGKLFEPNL